jgi:chromosome segregation ATPase
LLENPELEIQDRKLRGLRMRMNQRQEAVAQQLQLQADDALRAKHTAQVDAARETTRSLDQRRQELVTEILATLQKLRAAEDAARRRGEIEVQVQQLDTEIEWLRSRVASIDTQIAELRAQQPPPEKVEASEVLVSDTQRTRYTGAALAGGVAFAAAWVTCALMVAGLPKR